MEMVLEELTRFGPPVFDELVRTRLALEGRLARERRGKLKRRLKSQLRTIEQRIEKIEQDFCQGLDSRTCRRERRIFRRLLNRYARLVERERDLDPRNRYLKEFNDKRDLLQALGYIEGDKLTAAGMLASQIHGHELLVVETWRSLPCRTPAELNAICVSIGYEPRRTKAESSTRLT